MGEYRDIGIRTVDLEITKVEKMCFNDKKALELHSNVKRWNARLYKRIRHLCASTSRASCTRFRKDVSRLWQGMGCCLFGASDSRRLRRKESLAMGKNQRESDSSSQRESDGRWEMVKQRPRVRLIPTLTCYFLLEEPKNLNH